MPLGDWIALGFMTLPFAALLLIRFFDFDVLNRVRWGHLVQRCAVAILLGGILNAWTYRRYMWPYEWRDRGLIIWALGCFAVAFLAAGWIERVFIAAKAPRAPPSPPSPET